MTRPTVRARRALVLVLAVAATWWSVPVVAGAHGDEGVMTITSATATGQSIRVEVGLIYANDDELAVDATVTAQLTGPGGATVGPLAVAHVGDGAVYAADIPVPSPGSWAVAVTSDGPTATASTVVEVSAPSTTVSPTTSAPSPPTTTAAAPTTTVAGDDSGSSTSDGDGGNGLVIAVIVGAVLLALLAGFVGWRLSRRER